MGATKLPSSEEIEAIKQEESKLPPPTSWHIMPPGTPVFGELLVSNSLYTGPARDNLYTANVIATGEMLNRQRGFFIAAQGRGRPVVSAYSPATQGDTPSTEGATEDARPNEGALKDDPGPA